MSQALLPFPWLDLVLILFLVAINGVLSMSELAIVSAREARLKAMAKSGSGGAKVALQLAADPGRFLSTVQIGITLIGILAGAFSGARLGTPVAQRLAMLGVEPETAATAGFLLVIVLTTYASLVIGELVPKQFALRKPEPIAAVMARPMLWMSKATAPFVWLLDRTSAAIFKALGLKRESEYNVTAEELHLVVAEAHTSGVLEESERAIISGIVRLADRPVREVMTPRTEIDWIDVGCGREEIRAALAVLRSAEVPLALVHDEYGHLDGIVTPGSIIAALAGAFASDLETDDDPPMIEREDGSWLVSGAASADMLTDRLGLSLPTERDFSTVAGFALWVLKHIPETGERFAHDSWTFEVVDMDGRKIDKLIASRPRRKRRDEPAALAG